MKISFKVIVLIFATLAFAAILIFPVIDDVTMRKGLAILIFTAILWITEALPLPVTALLVPVLATLLGVLGMTDSLVNFSNPIIFLFLGGFILAAALSKFHIDHWVARKMIKLGRGNFIIASIMVMSATAFISMWVSNTSTAAMMLPMALGLIALTGKSKHSNEAKFILLGIAYSANIGGVVTLIGSPPNAIGASILDISFPEWLMYGVPMFIATFPVMILVLYLLFKPDTSIKLEALKVEEKLEVNRKLIALVVIFLLTVTGWMLEGVLGNLLGISSGFNTLVVMGSVALLSIFRVMKWEEMQAGVDWGVLLLFGGGITLGSVLETTGLGEFITSFVVLWIEDMPLILLMFVIVIVSIFFTEIMSNTASAALFVPLLFSLSGQLDLSPDMLVIPATLAASYGFMLPVGTPPNAIVFGSGYIKQRDMLKAGIILNLLFAVIVTLVTYLIKTM